MSEIIRDIFLSNYWDKRTGNAILVDTDQISTWVYYFCQHEFEGTNYIRGYGQFSDVNVRFLKCMYIPNFIHVIVFNILKLGDGKISLCGGAVKDILTGKNDFINNYDLFFHCESIGEADDLLDKCMKYIGSLALKKICYKRSQYVQTIKILNTLSIKFIRRVYKTKDQILLGFDLAGSRLGWNPKDGLFA